MRNKKGISPLIGTVLLVAITIAMVLMIMPWITKTIRTQQEKTTEASRAFDCITSLSFDVMKDVDNTIKIDNKGSLAIKSLTIRNTVLATGAVSESKYPATPTTIPAVNAYSLVDTALPCTAGNSISVVATISSEGKDVVCSDAPAEFTC